jgi:hypothetical protein
MALELDDHHEFDLLKTAVITNVPVHEKNMHSRTFRHATCYNSDSHNTSVLQSRLVTNILLAHLLRCLGVFYMDALA